MRTKTLLTITVAFSIWLTACTGSKKEQKNDTPESESKSDKSSAQVMPSGEVKAFENVDASVKSQINGFLIDYYALNQALIEDNQDAAKASAIQLSETVSKFDMSQLTGDQMDFYHEQSAKLNQGLKGISQSADIEETRLELVTISEGMYALIKAYHPNQSELYYQFCPMAKNGDGANWLSSTKEIINPYMGQRMLKCGKTVETIN